MLHNNSKYDEKLKGKFPANNQSIEPKSSLTAPINNKDKLKENSKSLKAPRNAILDSKNETANEASPPIVFKPNNQERASNIQNDPNENENQECISNNNLDEKEIELTDEEEFEKEIKKIASREKSMLKDPSQLNINHPLSLDENEHRSQGFEEDKHERFEEQEKRIEYLDNSSSDNRKNAQSYTLLDNNNNSDDESFEDKDEDGRSDNGNPNNVRYEENMPRLDENIDDEKVKHRKKKKKTKVQRFENQQDFNDIIREQMKKHEKSQNQKDNTKAKKSYHAYLEHPRMRHQATRQSPKSKDRNSGQGEFNSRPKK